MILLKEIPISYFSVSSKAGLNRFFMYNYNHDFTVEQFLTILECSFTRSKASLGLLQNHKPKALYHQDSTSYREADLSTLHLHESSR